MRTVISKSSAYATRGYTLIEMAIVMAVIGIFIASFAQGYRVYLKDKAEKATYNAQTESIAAVNSFLAKNGRYPCPARLDVDRNHPDYGMEGVCNIADAAYPSAMNPGNCANGICIEESNRALSVNNRVRRGALPFRALGMPEDSSYDGWGMRLQYAVTEKLTVNTTYNKDEGGISVIERTDAGTDRSASEPAHSVHFVLFSNGADRAGAYSRNGKQYSACPTTSDQGENCNTSLATKEAVYRQSPRSTSSGAGSYDDSFHFSSSADTPLWRVTDDSSQNIGDLAGAGGQLAIGGSDTVPAGVKVDVADDVKVDDKVHTQAIAGAAGESSFAPEKVLDGGEAENMKCPAGQYVKSIIRGQVECAPVGDLRCGPKQVMTGIEADGKIKCESFYGCPAEQRGGGCWEWINLPARPKRSEYVYTYTVNGANKRAVFLCHDNGQWSTGDYSGSCEPCFPEDEIVNMTCNDAMEAGGGNYTGTWPVRRRFFCPEREAEWTTTTDYNSVCTCTPTTRDEQHLCPEGYTGHKLVRRNWTCNANNTGQWSNYQVVQDNCTCGGAPETRTQNCPQGFTGTWTQSRTMNCGTGAWGSWTPSSPPSGACTCNNGEVVQTKTGCPSGQVGEIVTQKTMNCAAGGFGPETIISNTCGTVKYYWRAKSGGTTSSVALPIKKDAECGAPGTTASCSAPSGTQHLHYNCKCE